jgi:hypothetical protein
MLTPIAVKVKPGRRGGRAIGCSGGEVDVVFEAAFEFGDAGGPGVDGLGHGTEAIRRCDGVRVAASRRGMAGGLVRSRLGASKTKPATSHHHDK